MAEGDKKCESVVIKKKKKREYKVKIKIE